MDKYNLLVECLIPFKHRSTMYSYILLTGRLYTRDPISLSGRPLYTDPLCTGLFYLDCPYVDLVAAQQDAISFSSSASNRKFTWTDRIELRNKKNSASHSAYSVGKVSRQITEISWTEKRNVLPSFPLIPLDTVRYRT